jgi:hypothetical protein
VVAYIRGLSESDIAEQQKTVDEFCARHGYKVVSRHFDLGDKPATGLNGALASLQSADALIVSDLQRLVAHPDSRERDLRPLLHQFLCQNGKHLIAVAEGINTGTPGGQLATTEFINQLKDAEAEPTWFNRGNPV